MALCDERQFAQGSARQRLTVRPKGSVRFTPLEAPVIVSVALVGRRTGAPPLPHSRWHTASLGGVHLIELYFWQLSLTIVKFVTVMWPCSVECVATPCSFASVFASSFMPCILALETTPVTATLWPT